VGTYLTPSGGCHAFLLSHVSIQLMSPASGDRNPQAERELYQRVSIQLMSPASGDLSKDAGIAHGATFPFN
jgi:hypothetical protein